MKKTLFIVEGKSAASTLQQALNPNTQAVLALQGKLINVQKSSSSKVLNNVQCQKLFKVLACGIKEHCNAEQLDFQQIVILTDPDVDGIHARALLLMLFDLYLKPLIAAGVVFVVIPPLFRVMQKKDQPVYFWSRPEMTAEDTELTRFKGIAQFSKKECGDLFLSGNYLKRVG